MNFKCFILFILFCFNLTSAFAQKLAEKEVLIKGNIAYSQKKYKEAQTSYEKSITENNKSLKGNYNLGNAFYNQNKPNEAINHYQKASKLTKEKSDLSSIHHNLGNAYMKQKEYQNAVKAYKNSLKNNPLDDQTRYNYALAKKMSETQEDKKPQEQKDKEKKKKEEQKKQQKDNQNENQNEPNKETDNAKKKQQGDKKDGNEKNNSNQQQNKPQIDPKLAEGILRAIERQEKQTHKRIIEEQKTAPTQTNKKDW